MSYSQLISKWVLPPPSQISVAIFDLLQSGELGRALMLTMIAVGVCSLWVAIFGVIIGYILYLYPLFGTAYEDLLGALFAIPMVLMFPIFLVVFGRSYTAITVCAFLHCVLPVIIYTREAFLGVPATFLNVGKVFRLNRRKMLWKIIFPQALPTVFVGIRLSVTYVLVYVLSIEFLISFGGLGRLISDMYARFEISKTYAVILVAFVLSTTFNLSLKRFEAWLRRWR